MLPRPHVLVVLGLLLLALLPGCGKTDPHARGFVNTMCPVLGGDIVTDDPALAIEYQGQKIGFC